MQHNFLFSTWTCPPMDTCRTVWHSGSQPFFHWLFSHWESKACYFKCLRSWQLRALQRQICVLCGNRSLLQPPAPAGSHLLATTWSLILIRTNTKQCLWFKKVNLIGTVGQLKPTVSNNTLVWLGFLVVTLQQQLAANLQHQICAALSLYFFSGLKYAWYNVFF